MRYYHSIPRRLDTLPAVAIRRCDVGAFRHLVCVLGPVHRDALPLSGEARSLDELVDQGLRRRKRAEGTFRTIRNGGGGGSALGAIS